MRIDRTILRAAFSRFLTGVTVVTTRTATGEPVGFTANSFSSVSLNPPMLLVCPGNHLSSFHAFRDATQFGVSILAEGQEVVSNLFASRADDRFANCDWEEADGMPLIAGRAAGFVCTTSSVVAAGDHIVLIGQVSHFDDAARPGLGYGPDGYFSQSKERKAEAAATRASVLLDDGARVYLTDQGQLPTVPVQRGESPLSVLEAGLIARQIRADLSVVYAIYDEGETCRHIVFRGRTKGLQPGLQAQDIVTLDTSQANNTAVRALLDRFRQEHRTQSFGLYVGDAHAGDVLPAQGRD
ncbi:flavin reductase family protein [uncultured Roseobacter sp.]|uniref:flavin reductase family protein n=1 Tax=uncultured Roseobacter sp. TaxID=114847 RepID=UPI0026296238|nr:flavin reductase family protein [uncultured Roseobacter sp.]